MVDTDWGEIADERFNEKLDFKKISSKKDYMEELTKYLRKSPQGRAIIEGKGKIPHNARDQMYEDSKAKEEVEERQEEELEKAQTFQKKRGRKGRIDAKRTAKDTRGISRRTIRSWRKKPSAFDIRGIDTKTLVKTPRKHLITKQDIALREKGIRVGLDVRGQKHYRYSAGHGRKSGRFMKKPD